MNKRRKAHRYGLWAEHLAAWWLRFKGYHILEMRHRNPFGEIDLIATKGNTVIAVEVKARQRFTDCEESVPRSKQIRIMRAMEGFLMRHRKMTGLAGGFERNIRFDVVWVVRGFLPRHMKDAWRQ